MYKINCDSVRTVHTEASKSPGQKRTAVWYGQIQNLEEGKYEEGNPKYDVIRLNPV